jgi:hypothetical protein
MKKAIFIFYCLIIMNGNLFAQSKEFEGRLMYDVKIKSDTTGMIDDFYKLLFGMEADKLTVEIKGGNIRRVQGISTEYQIFKDKRVYIKFKNIDTLYYRDYSPDTSALPRFLKMDSTISLAGFTCNSILVKRPDYSSMFCYTNTLFINPDYAGEMDHYNLFAKEVNGGVWLYSRTEYSKVTLIDSCIKVEQHSINDHAFDLPELPQQKFNVSNIYSLPVFPGKKNSWIEYIANNLDKSLSVKYVKLPRKQDTASVSVIVGFVISKDGSVVNAKAINAGNINSKLVQEAVRVIQESPRWQPATLYGEKTIAFFNQPVTFVVSR